MWAGDELVWVTLHHIFVLRLIEHHLKHIILDVLCRGVLVNDWPMALTRLTWNLCRVNIMGLIVGTSDYTHKFLTVVWDQEL